MVDIDNTLQFKKVSDNPETSEEVLATVSAAMLEKGYDPINQLVGYLTSGDPTYITSHKNARYLIRRKGRDELVEELVRFYLTNDIK